MLNFVFNQFVQKLFVIKGVCKIQVLLEHLDKFWPQDVHICQVLRVKAQLSHHVQSLERFRKINFKYFIQTFIMNVPLWDNDLLATVKFFAEPLEHLLCHRHQVLVISVSHVKLQTCELWVMGPVDALVPEDSTNFENSFEATDDQLFQIKFGCNSKLEILFQSFRSCQERFG